VATFGSSAIFLSQVLGIQTENVNKRVNGSKLAIASGHLWSMNVCFLSRNPSGEVKVFHASLSRWKESKLFFTMEDDLSQMWKKLSLTEEESLELDTPAEETIGSFTRGQYCVLGKLIADHWVSMETIKDYMSRWWKLTGKLSFQVLGENLFLLEFTDLTDKKRILEGRPWVFEGSLFNIEDFDGTSSPSSFKFDKAGFWIRMVDLPLVCMNQDTGRRIGSTVGLVEAVDTGKDGIGWGKYLRVKVVMDLFKPLARGRMLKLQGKSSWVVFQYERLPKFCFRCGVIVHGPTGCPMRSAMHYPDHPGEYGLWLRAPSPHEDRRREEVDIQVVQTTPCMRNQQSRGSGTMQMTVEIKAWRMAEGHRKSHQTLSVQNIIWKEAFFWQKFRKPLWERRFEQRKFQRKVRIECKI
jgi:hypothetical protein